MRLRFLLPVLACLAPAACSLAPAAVTVGPSTLVVRPPNNAVDRYFLDVHEWVHREQFRREGTGRMLGAYLARPSVRLRLEAEAYATALCAADRAGAHPRLRRRLYDAYVRALRSYVPGPRMPVSDAQRYLDGSYRDGSGCAELAARIGSPPPPAPEVVTLLRTARPLPRLAAMQARPSTAALSTPAPSASAP